MQAGERFAYAVFIDSRRAHGYRYVYNATESFEGGVRLNYLCSDVGWHLVAAAVGPFLEFVDREAESRWDAPCRLLRARNPTVIADALFDIVNTTPEIYYAISAMSIVVIVNYIWHTLG